MLKYLPVFYWPYPRCPVRRKVGWWHTDEAPSVNRQERPQILVLRTRTQSTAPHKQAVPGYPATFQCRTLAGLGWARRCQSFQPGAPRLQAQICSEPLSTRAQLPETEFVITFCGACSGFLLSSNIMCEEVGNNCKVEAYRTLTGQSFHVYYFEGRTNCKYYKPCEKIIEPKKGRIIRRCEIKCLRGTSWLMQFILVLFGYRNQVAAMGWT